MLADYDLYYASINILVSNFAKVLLKSKKIFWLSRKLTINL